MPYINVLGNRTYYHQSSNYQASRTTILCIHGAGGTGEIWTHQLSRLGCYNLIAPDLPGHGLSDGKAADDILEYRDFVWSFSQVLGIGPFIIAGHSMGGAIALEFALKYSMSLKSIIIVGSGARLRVNPSILEGLSSGTHPVMNIQYSYAENTTAEVLEKAALAMKSVPIEVLQADFTACNKFDIMDRLHKISIPALVICGQEDQMTPFKYSEYLFKHLPHSILVPIADAGHMAMSEQPERVNRALIDFLTQTIE